MGNYRVAGDDIFRLGFVDSPSPEGLGAGDVSGASADAMNGVPTGDDLFRLGFADPLTGPAGPASLKTVHRTVFRALWPS